MKKHNCKQGFTLIEAVGTIVMVVLALGLALGGYMYMFRNTNEGDLQSELDIDIQIAMERLKTDLRLSSLDKIFYHPAGAGPYTALSFPLAEDSDGDGLFELDDDEKIIWDKTVIYHIWPSSPHQLRITTFKNRNNTLTDAQRQSQLNSVVDTGGGSSTFNGNNAATTTLFENLLEWSIRPNKGIYDAYSPIVEREKSSLGYALISDGSHKFSFKVAGKNAASTGYHVGIDQLTVSASYGEREAEEQLPATAMTGATPVKQYMDSGSWKGNHQLYFPAASAGSGFTLTMDNDKWEETNFDGLGYATENTRVVFDETLSPPDFTVQLGNTGVTWSAANQTGDEFGSSSTGTLKNAAIRIMQKGSELADNGNWFAYDGRKCRLTFAASDFETFKVLNVFIGESAASTNSSMDFMDTSAVKAVKFGTLYNVTIPPGGKVTSEWIDLPIDRDKNYLVSFRIANNAAKDGPKIWYDANALDPANPTPLTTMVVEGAGSAIAKDKTWSDRADISPYMTNYVFGLEGIEVSYPETGSYTSPIFDTRLSKPTYGDIKWNADVPTGTTLSFKVRSGDNPDLSDALDWDSITAFTSQSFISASYKRYIQFQTQMTSDTTGLETPKLKDVTLDWTSPLQLVNISGTFTKGPDYGIVEVYVDGVPLQSSMEVDLMIYKDIISINDETKRITSSLISDIKPRNTGK